VILAGWRLSLNTGDQGRPCCEEPLKNLSGYGWVGQIFAGIWGNPTRLRGSSTDLDSTRWRAEFGFSDSRPREFPPYAITRIILMIHLLLMCIISGNHPEKRACIRLKTTRGIFVSSASTAGFARRISFRLWVLLSSEPTTHRASSMGILSMFETSGGFCSQHDKYDCAKLSKRTQ
jgi:hypothetical protein